MQLKARASFVCLLALVLLSIATWAHATEVPMYASALVQSDAPPVHTIQPFAQDDNVDIDGNPIAPQAHETHEIVSNVANQPFANIATEVQPEGLTEEQQAEIKKENERWKDFFRGDLDKQEVTSSDRINDEIGKLNEEIGNKAAEIAGKAADLVNACAKQTGVFAVTATNGNFMSKMQKVCAYLLKQNQNRRRFIRFSDVSFPKDSGFALEANVDLTGLFGPQTPLLHTKFGCESTDDGSPTCALTTKIQGGLSLTFGDLITRAGAVVWGRKRGEKPSTTELSMRKKTALFKFGIQLTELVIQVNDFGFRLTGNAFAWDAVVEINLFFGFKDDKPLFAVEFGVAKKVINSVVNNILGHPGKTESPFPIFNIDRFSAMVALNEIKFKEDFSSLAWGKIKYADAGLTLRMLTSFKKESTNGFLKMMYEATEGKPITSIARVGWTGDFKMALELPDFWFSKSKKLGFANGKMGLEFETGTNGVSLKVSAEGELAVNLQNKCIEPEAGEEFVKNKPGYCTHVLALGMKGEFDAATTEVGLAVWMRGEWRRPFGIPKLALANLEGSIKVTPEMPHVTHVSLGGAIILGQYGTGKRVESKAYIGIDLLHPLQNYLYASISPVTLSSLLELFDVDADHLPEVLHDAGFPEGGLLSMAGSKIELNVPIQMAQKDKGVKEIKKIQSGLEVRGKFVFMDIWADVHLVVRTTKLQADFSCSAFSLPARTSLVTFSDKEFGPDGKPSRNGPKFHFLASLSPFKLESSFQGFVSTPFFKGGVDVYLGLSGFKFELDTQFLGLIQSKVTVEATLKPMRFLFEATLDSAAIKKNTIDFLQQFQRKLADDIEQRRIKRSDVAGIGKGAVTLTAYKPLQIEELTDADVEVGALSQQLGEEGTHLLETDSEFELFAESGMEVEGHGSSTTISDEIVKIGIRGLGALSHFLNRFEIYATVKDELSFDKAEFYVLFNARFDNRVMHFERKVSCQSPATFIRAAAYEAAVKMRTTFFKAFSALRELEGKSNTIL